MKMPLWQHCNYYGSKGKFTSHHHLTALFSSCCHTVPRLFPSLHCSLFLKLPDYLPFSDKALTCYDNL